MKITAITRYKHGELYAILNRLGWTQSELARRSGLSPDGIGRILNINKRPSQKTANAIQTALGEAGEYLDVLEEWPESFKGIKQGARKEETMEVPMERLIGCREAMIIVAPNEQDKKKIYEAIDYAMDELSDRERRVIEARYFECVSLADIAKEFGLLSSERIRQIEAKALRKLRRPKRIENIERFSELLEA